MLKPFLEFLLWAGAGFFTLSAIAGVWFSGALFWEHARSAIIPANGGTVGWMLSQYQAVMLSAGPRRWVLEFYYIAARLAFAALCLWLVLR